MEAHELAKKLLEMPNETVFIEDESGHLWNIKDIVLCTCGCEIIISHQDY